jgi:hypothetical protein
VPKNIPLEVRIKIIELLILGNSVADTAKATNVSESSVRTVQEEFNAGKITGYETFADRLADLNWAAAKLRENGQALEKVDVGWATHETLGETGTAQP